MSKQVLYMNLAKKFQNVKKAKNSYSNFLEKKKSKIVLSNFPVILNEDIPLRFNVTFLVQDAIDLQLF